MSLKALISIRRIESRRDSIRCSEHRIESRRDSIRRFEQANLCLKALISIRRISRRGLFAQRAL